MGLRIQAFLLGVSLTFISSFSAALGLGEMTINSTLNQPLDAEVELLQVRSLTDQDLVVGLATADAFETAGVERAQFLYDLKFKVDLNDSRGPRVKITSSKAVLEPFLNFVIEAQWPSGRLLREYTILIDLPVFSGTKANTVTSAKRPAVQMPVETTSRPQTTRPRATRPANTSRSATVQPSAVRRTPSANQYDDDTYGPVKSTDTLWHIASRVRPDKSVSVQQTMLAIQRLNPDAFIKDNINLLRRGKVLRVPDISDISELSAREAIREVAIQNRNWNNRSAQSDDAAQLEGSKSYTPTRAETKAPEGRLKLSSRESEASDAGRALGEGEGAGEVESTLAATQEELDASTRENSDLRDRLTSMEEQIETMEKLLEVSSEEMRALELAAAKTNDDESASEELAAEDGIEEDPVIEGSDSEDANMESSEEQLESSVEQTESSAEQESQAEIKREVEKAPPVATPAKKSIMDILMENILYVGVGIGVLVLGIVGFLFMRNRDDGFDDDEFDEFTPNFESADSEDEFTYEEESEEPDDSTVLMPDSDDELEFEISEEDDATEAETEDVVAESDIHIAYGQYDQAEEKLLHALEGEPNNVSMRLKLLEVFAATNSIAEFDSHFRKLHALGDSDAVERAQQLRNSIDGVSAFDESSIAPLDSSDVNSDDFLGTDALTDNGDMGDDTLAFNLDDTDALLDSSDDNSSVDFDLELDAAIDSADDLDASLELGDIEDKTLTPDSDLDFSLDDELGDNAIDLDGGLDLDLDEADADAAVLQSGIETVSDDISENDLSLDGESTLGATESVDDLTFDLDDVEMDLDFDDVELDVDLGELEEPEDSFDGLDAALAELDSNEPAKDGVLVSDDDVTQIRSPSEDAPDDTSTSLNDPIDFDLGEFDSDSVDSTASDGALDLDADAELDDLDLDAIAEPTDAELPDFDFDEELDSVLDKQGESSDAGSLAESFTADGDSLDLSEFDDSLIDNADASVMAEPELSFDGIDEDLGEDLEDTFAQFNLEPEVEDDITTLSPTKDGEVEPEPVVTAGDVEPGESKDFDLDSDLDLDGEINLADLDQELDALASDFSGDTADLEEPEAELSTDFDLSATDLDDEPEPSLDAFAEPEDDADLHALKEDESVVPTVEAEFSGDQLDEDDLNLGDQSLDAAISSMDFEIPDFDPEEDDDSNLGFLTDSDETATKLDLARAYIDMGDADGAKDILDEIMEEGNDDQKLQAETLLAKLG